MMNRTEHYISNDMLYRAKKEFAFDAFKTPINNPTGNFFYDPWKIKDEYKNTVWDEILKTLPYSIGETRLINLKYGVCYQSHADIDDRYHLNIQGDSSYIINLDDEILYKLNNDGYWYDFNAGPRHTAINVGYHDRIQLVVRKLLLLNNVINPIKISILSKVNDIFENRFIFDNAISSLLNRYNKEGILSNFYPTENSVTFTINKYYLEELKKCLPSNFYIVIL